MLIDTHCHIDASEFNADRAQVIADARLAGLKAMLVPGVGPGNFESVRELAANNQDIVYALGIHPMHLAHVDETALRTLEAALEAARDDPNLVAVGEIGLDFFVPGFNATRQEYFYESQLRLAAKFDLPVILHVRRSQDRCLKYLRTIPVSGGIAHAFNGSQQQAQNFLQLGFALGFGGALTYPRALQIRRLVTELPALAHVLETDSPDISPEWMRGRRNEPAQLVRIAEVFAGLRNESVDRVADQTHANAVRVLPRLRQAISRD